MTVSPLGRPDPLAETQPVPGLTPQQVCTGRPGAQKKPCRLLPEQLKAGRGCPVGPAPLSLKKGDVTGWALP